MGYTVPPEQIGRLQANGRWTQGVSLWLPGLVLLALGSIVVTGWLTRNPLLIGLLPGFPPMVLNTALMFVASGIALAAIGRSKPRLAGLLGPAITVLALAGLSQHLFELDLGIDLPSLHTWARDGYHHPGRAAMATTLCFALAGAALYLLAHRPQRPPLWRLAALLAMLVVLISAVVGFGHILGLDPMNPAYPVRGMAVPTSAGLVLLGVSLLRAASPWSSTDAAQGADRRIVSVGTLLLVTVTLVTGLPIFSVVKSHIEDTTARGLRAGLQAQIRLIQTLLDLHGQRAAALAVRPDLWQALGTLLDEPGTAHAALDGPQSTLDGILQQGFSSLRLILPDGRVVAQSGEPLVEPALATTLGRRDQEQLLWQDGYFLRGRYTLGSGSGHAAVLEVEQAMPQMAGVISGLSGLGQTGEFQLCTEFAARIRCFPSRRHERPFELPLVDGDDTRLVVRAATGGAGLGRGRDALGHPVIGVYAPLADLGLFALLKVDAAELFRPLRIDMGLALAVALLVVLCGSVLFHALVRPLTAQLVRAREISQGKSRALEQLHAFQRAVFDQAPDGILVADPEGRIVEANERLASLFGYSRADLHGRRIEDLVPQRVRSAHHLHRAGYRRAPTTRPMSRDRTLQGQRADGSEFPIEVALAPLSTPAGGNVIAIVKDVSDTRRAEQAVREALQEKDLLLHEINDKRRALERLHAFQRAVFDQAPDGILVADSEGRIIEANERMAQLFGYARPELQGMWIEDLVPERVRAEHQRHRAGFQQAPSTRPMSRDRTLQGQRADGSEFPIEVALAPLSTPEGNRVIAIVKDVTEARQTEQAIRKALKEKDLLLGEIHHRVKNNLQIVHSLLDMQASLTADEGAASALRQSQNRIQSMALIHQTLYQSHDFAEVEFGRFLDTLTRHLQDSYGRRDLQLSSHAEAVRMTIDRAIPCGLIVNELVTNALKHAFPEDRGGSIRVELRRLGETEVEVAVSDDGVGIADALDFDSLSSLGMQLVQVLIEQLHAQLQIQRSNPTRFALRFALH